MKCFGKKKDNNGFLLTDRCTGHRFDLPGRANSYNTGLMVKLIVKRMEAGVGDKQTRVCCKRRKVPRSGHCWQLQYSWRNGRKDFQTALGTLQLQHLETWQVVAVGI